MNSVRDLTKEVKENEKTYNETNAVWEKASDNMKELWSELSDTALSSMDSMQEQAGITTEELENAFGNSLDTIEFDVKESNSRIEDSFSDMANSGAESGRDLSDGFNKNISDMPSRTSSVFDDISAFSYLCNADTCVRSIPLSTFKYKWCICKLCVLAVCLL